MRRIVLAWVLFLVILILPDSPASAQTTNRTAHTLLEGSYFIDDCLICERPTILEPLRGSFELVLLQDFGTYIQYGIENIDFVAGAGSSFERHLTGSGTYVRFEEFAVLQDMNLAVEIKDQYTNKLAFFTNDSRTVQQPFPLIQVELKQTNGTPLQTFSIQIFAAPVREIWFSTLRGFSTTNQSSTIKISAGDLISNQGRVVKSNLDLVGHLGVMPIVSDLGLDAVFVKGRGEILFSIPNDVFSETLGCIHHGDLLSNRGYIVKRNQELLASFNPASSADAGLDALQLMPNGEILFSIQSNVVTKSGATLSRGDILSDSGRIFMTHQQLLANFQPSTTNYDFGLDALFIMPGGEVWFSVEESFTDSRLGTVQVGDLLSSLGYRVFSNQDLLARFAPAQPSDYGLDALFVITDTQPPKDPPRIMKTDPSGSSMHLEWDGNGAVFQVETAPALSGPWDTCSPVVPDLSFDAGFNALPGNLGFYRLRQW